MRIQSYGDSREGLATLWPTPYPLFIGLPLRNLKRALANIVDAQKSDSVE
jgi:hypothetical protein